VYLAFYFAFRTRNDLLPNPEALLLA
jgi:hypothetical protein